MCERAANLWVLRCPQNCCQRRLGAWNDGRRAVSYKTLELGDRTSSYQHLTRLGVCRSGGYSLENINLDQCARVLKGHHQWLETCVDQRYFAAVIRKDRHQGRGTTTANTLMGAFFQQNQQQWHCPAQNRLLLPFLGKGQRRDIVGRLQRSTHIVNPVQEIP